MKFIILSSELLSRLKKLERVISQRNSIPILDNLLFVVSESKITITASDLEHTLIAEITVENIEGSGSFCVDARRLIEFLSKISAKSLVFKVSEKELNISSDSGSYKMMLIKDNYPNYATVTGNKFSLLSSDFLNAFRKCTPSISKDSNIIDIMPIIDSVCIDVREGKTTFVSTDKNRMSIIESELIDIPNGIIVIPSKHCNALKSILPRDTKITMSYDLRNCEILFDEFIYIFRLQEGTYPDWRSIIPKPEIKITLNRVEFFEKINTISAFGGVVSLVKIELSNGKIQLEAQDIYFSVSGKETMICNYFGESLIVGISGKMLIELLSVMDSEYITIELIDEKRAILIRPEKNELYLLMPMMPN